MTKQLSNLTNNGRTSPKGENEINQNYYSQLMVIGLIRGGATGVNISNPHYLIREAYGEPPYTKEGILDAEKKRS